MKEESRKMKKGVEETEMRSAGMKRWETQIERERESDEQAKRERQREKTQTHTKKTKTHRGKKGREMCCRLRTGSVVVGGGVACVE